MAQTDTTDEAIATRERIKGLYDLSLVRDENPEPCQCNDEDSAVEDLREDYPGQRIG